MEKEWRTVPGIVVLGHRVASGPSKEYPYGSLEKQIPLIKTLGLNLTSFHLGTINISISRKKWAFKAAEYTFQHVEWIDFHPPEDFTSGICRLLFRDNRYIGWIYHPHPEYKTKHFQDLSTIVDYRMD